MNEVARSRFERRLGYGLGARGVALEKVRRQYGPESIAGLAHGLSNSHVEHFVRSLGSPNVADPSYAECRALVTWRGR